MAAYAAIAVGLINLRYQTGSENNFAKSAALFIPGALLLGLSFLEVGKKTLQSKAAAAIVITYGGLLLAYSFIV
jgi:hypothetical protein